MPDYTLAADRCALIVQDLQNDVMIEGGAFADSGAPEHAKEQNVVENVKDLAGFCRDKGIPVIHVWYVVEEGAPGLKVNAPLFEGVAGGALVRGTWGAAAVDGLEAQDGDFVVEKMRMSAWQGTRLENLLEGLGRDTIIVTGAWTNMSIEHTSRTGADKGYYMVVPEDGCSTMNADWHRASIEYALQNVSTVTNCADVKAALPSSGRRSKEVVAATKSTPSGMCPRRRRGSSRRFGFTESCLAHGLHDLLLQPAQPVVEGKPRRVRVGLVEGDVALLGDVELCPEREAQALEGTEPGAEIGLRQRLGVSRPLELGEREELPLHQPLTDEAGVLLVRRVVVRERRREEPVERGIALRESSPELAWQCGEHLALGGREPHAKPPVAASLDPPAQHPQSCCMVAQRPLACRRETSSSAFSRVPDETTALPSLCTCSMSFVAFAWEYPKSCFRTRVTYDIRLIGSFQTITIHGTS